MPDTYSLRDSLRDDIQIVFAVKGRENLINNGWKTELHKYIAGIIKAGLPDRHG